MSLPDPPELDFGPPRLRAWAKAICQALVKSRLVDVMGGNLSERDTGQALTIGDSNAAASEILWHPFLVGIGESLSDGTPQVSVDSNSDLWKDFGNKFPITGLDQSFTVKAGDLIWLHIGVKDKDNIIPDEASIEHGDSAWDGHPCPITYGTDETTGINYQETYEKIIAEVVDKDDPRDGVVVGTGDKAVKILQHLKSALMCTVWAIDGVLCLVPEEMEL